MINLGALATVSDAISCPALDALHLGIYIHHHSLPLRRIVVYYIISTILACLFTVGVQILWKNLLWKGSIVAEMPSCASPTLCIILYGG